MTNLSSLPAFETFATTVSFRQLYDFYLERVNLSESKLAACIRETQQRLNKISNGKLQNVDVETLVRICLVLGLTEDEAVDLMSRRERAFSPANPVHKVYRELIRMYAEKRINYRWKNNNLGNILDNADMYLESKGFASFKRYY